MSESVPRPRLDVAYCIVLRQAPPVGVTSRMQRQGGKLTWGQARWEVSDEEL